MFENLTERLDPAYLVMEEMPTMREWRRRYKDHLNAIGPEYGAGLTPVQLLFMAPDKPAEELYDLDSDPYEVRNLAGSLEHQAVLARMRQALDAWQKHTGDLGLVSEAELRERALETQLADLKRRASELQKQLDALKEIEQEMADSQYSPEDMRP